MAKAAVKEKRRVQAQTSQAVIDLTGGDK